jgi:uroporphyrinogen decarboxylase
LRGTENLYMDLAYGDKEVYKLRDMLHEFYVREIEMWLNTGVDGIQFMDDWGSQNALLISPTMWREFFKPLYKDYCNLIHSKGKYVFMHSDGNIESIYPDLIEIGVDALNSQLFCMDIEKLGELYAEKIAFWGEIDRQWVLPFGTPEEVRNAVKRISRALLKNKRTGVFAQCEWGVKDPKENIVAVFEEWDKC